MEEKDSFGDKLDIAGLIRKFVQNELLTIPEEQALKKWLQGNNARQQMLNDLADAALMEQELTLFRELENDSNRKFNEIRKAIGEDHRTAKTILKIAAVALVVVTTGYFGMRYFVSGKDAQNLAAITHKDVAPGKKQAQLVLSDGKTLTLDDSSHTSWADQQATINKNKGTLTYKGATTSGYDVLAFNILRVARGGEYDVVLEDGTHVWLNANSSLRYPTHFNTTERMVELTGEAYFEVAKNKNKPFLVKVPAQANQQEEVIKVLGTHFNVQAYEDEPARTTTLLEGAVQISQGAQQGLLKPGEQASFTQGQYLLLPQVDLEDVIAWKNGYFSFNNTGISGIMRQVSRWYDIEVIWKGEKPTKSFSGTLRRNTNLSTVLKVLELDGKYRIEGNQLIVE